MKVVKLKNIITFLKFTSLDRLHSTLEVTQEIVNLKI